MPESADSLIAELGIRSSCVVRIPEIVAKIKILNLTDGYTKSIRIVGSSMPELDLFARLQKFQDEELLVYVNGTHGLARTVGF